MILIARAERPERMTKLLLRQLSQVIEAEQTPDAKTLRDCVSVLKDLTALSKEQQPQEADSATGVVILPAVKEEA